MLRRNFKRCVYLHCFKMNANIKIVDSKYTFKHFIFYRFIQKKQNFIIFILRIDEFFFAKSLQFKLFRISNINIQNFNLQTQSFFDLHTFKYSI